MWPGRKEKSHFFFSFLFFSWLQKLAAFHARVSDPKDELYGQYKSLDEIRDMVAPSKQTVQRVTDYFATAGFTDIELVRSGDMLIVHGSPAVVNAALKTELLKWSHPKYPQPIWRSVRPYSLPAPIGKHIDFISGIHHFPRKQKAIFGTPTPSYEIGPKDLQTRYNVTDSYGGNNGTQAVAEFQGQYYSPQDLQTFFQK